MITDIIKPRIKVCNISAEKRKKVTEMWLEETLEFCTHFAILPFLMKYMMIVNS